jgi:hypothetical protein
METGTFPEALKQAKVIPLYKGGARSDAGNWRPISILPLLSKILEEVVHHRLYDHLMKLRRACQTKGIRKKKCKLSCENHKPTYPDFTSEKYMLQILPHNVT